MRKFVIAAACLAVSFSVSAQLTQDNGCSVYDPMNPVTCTGTNQNIGDISTINQDGDSHSTTTMLGNSSGSNVSGNTVGFDNRSQQTQTGTLDQDAIITGGDSSSRATTGDSASTGNLTSVDTGDQVSASGAISGAAAFNGPQSQTGVSNRTDASADGGTALSGSRSGANAEQTASVKSSNESSVAGSGNSRASTLSGAASGVDKSGNSETKTSVNLTDSSRTDVRYNFIPPIIPGTPPSTNTVAGVIKETTACGPLQRVVKTPVTGTFHGLIGTSEVNQGFTYDLEEYLDRNGNLVMYHQVPLETGDGYRLIGHQAIMMVSVVGVSGARHFALGGGSGKGDWGQGGTGTSSANQRQVVNIQLKLCEAAVLQQGRVEILPLLAPPAE